MSENAELKWYVVHTYSGYENKVKANLEKSVENGKPEYKELITAVEIPTEIVTEIKNNHRKEIERKIMPGYVLVRMVMTNETWYLVRNTRGVTGFVGAGNKPLPLSDADYQKIYDAAVPYLGDIEIGDDVKLLDGVFIDQVGKVKDIDIANNKVTVVVSMFNQDTEVELAYDQVLKAN